MSYMVDKAPSVDPILQRQVRVWEPKEHRPTLTWSRSGYKPYNTYVFYVYIHAMARLTFGQGQEQVLAVGTGGEGPTVDTRLNQRTFPSHHCTYQRVGQSIRCCASRPCALSVCLAPAIRMED